MRGAGSRPSLAESVSDSICRRSRVWPSKSALTVIRHRPGLASPPGKAPPGVARGPRHGRAEMVMMAEPWTPFVLYRQGTRRHSLVSGEAA